MLEVELDLELITGADGEVYAYRSNLPFPLRLWFKRSGSWEFTEDTDNLSVKDIVRLEDIKK
jgi:hypothetical protein